MWVVHGLKVAREPSFVFWILILNIWKARNLVLKPIWEILRLKQVILVYCDRAGEWDYGLRKSEGPTNVEDAFNFAEVKDHMKSDQGIS